MESKAMKREYMKPTMNVVELQHHPAGDGFWGR